MKFIGKIIIKTKEGRTLTFVIVEFDKVNNPEYKIFVEDNPYYFSKNTDYPLGEMLRAINLGIEKEGEIKYNDLPNEIMELANKEVVLLGLEQNEY